MGKSKRLRFPGSFLVINPFGIGDVIFSTPLIANLKNVYPHSRIYYLCNRRTYQILHNNPHIEGTFIYDRDEFEQTRRISTWAWLKKISAFFNRIRHCHVQVTLDLSLNSQFGFFSLLAGIPRRVGLDYKGRGRFLTDKVPFEGFLQRHVADYYLDLLRVLDIPLTGRPLEVYVGPQDKRWAREFIARHGLDNKRLIGLVPCGGEAFGKDAGMRRWPEEKFARLARQLIEQFSVEILLFAGPKEKKEIAALCEAAGPAKEHCHSLTDISLGEMIALMEYCSLFIGNNTGPLRFADALGKKIIALAGPVDEAVYGSYPSDPDRTVVISKHLSCQPCYRKFRLPPCRYNRRCLGDITVPEVASAANRFLASGG